MNPTDRNAPPLETDAYEGIERCPICSLEACEIHIPKNDQASNDPKVSKQSKPATPTFSRASDVMSAPPPVEIAESVVWAQCVTVLVSESGAGKTFLLLDVAAAVSAGGPWHGRRTKAGSIAYISYEGDAMGLRLRALKEHGHALEHLYVLRASDPLSPAIDRDHNETPSRGECHVVDALVTLCNELANEGLPPLVLVVFDTVRASMTGSEDNSEAVSGYLRAVKRVLEYVPTAGAILAHHAGWQDGKPENQKKRERGSSAFRGNVDATLYLEAGSYDRDTGIAPLTLSTRKVRDGELPPPLKLRRVRVELNEAVSDDIRDGAVTSCVIEADRRSSEDIEAATQAKATLETIELDLKTLRALASRTDQATSKSDLQLLVGRRYVDVVGSLSRLIQNGWVALPEKLRQPYQVTSAGLEALNGGATH